MKRAVLGKVVVSLLALSTAAAAESLQVSLGGSNKGPIVSVAGGTGTTVQPLGGGGMQAMSTGKTMWSPVRIEANTAAPSALFGVMNDVLQGKSGGSNLEVVTFDAKGSPTAVTKYTSPLLAEVDLPVLSKSDKSPATFAVSFAIAGATSSPPSGSLTEARSPATWTHASFDAQLAGFSAAPIGVSSLQIVVPRPVGSGVAAGKASVSGFHLVFDGSQLGALQGWLAQGKVSSMNGAGAGGYSPKDVRIVYHAQQKERSFDLFTVSLKNCGPLAVVQQGSNADVDVRCSDFTFASVAP